MPELLAALLLFSREHALARHGALALARVCSDLMVGHVSDYTSVFVEQERKRKDKHQPLQPEEKLSAFEMVRSAECSTLESALEKKGMKRWLAPSMYKDCRLVSFLQLNHDDEVSGNDMFYLHVKTKWPPGIPILLHLQMLFRIRKVQLLSGTGFSHLIMPSNAFPYPRVGFPL